jgi:hypothetical protein
VTETGLELRHRYPPALLELRERVAAEGSFRDRVRFDLVDRPAHAFGLLAAADVAAFAGVGGFVAIEFGVAEGAGLRNVAEVAAAVTAETGVEIDVVGFDSGEGLPAPLDHRDHPEIWAEGDFAPPAHDAVQSTLPDGATLVLGEVAATVPEFVASSSRPVGFASFDLDYYRSTRDALQLFDLPAAQLLPVVVSYFDDVIGGIGRIGSLFRTEAAGPLLAIREFNEGHDDRHLDPIRILPYRRPLDRELWLERTYALHVLDHDARSARARPSLTMSEHGRDSRFAWPL